MRFARSDKREKNDPRHNTVEEDETTERKRVCTYTREREGEREMRGRREGGRERTHTPTFQI